MRNRLLLVAVLAASTALAAKPVVLTDVPKGLFPHVQRALAKGHTLLPAKFSEDLGAYEITANCKDGGAVAALVGETKGKVHTVRLYNCADASLVDTRTFTAAEVARARGIPAAAVKAWTAALAKCGGVTEVLPPEPPVPPLVTASADEVKQAEAHASAELASAAAEEAARGAEAAKRAEEAAAAKRAEEAAAAKRAEEAAKAAAAAAQPAKVAAKPEAATAPAVPAQATGLSALRASFALRTFNRAYDYGGNASASLSTYSMSLGSAVAVDLSWYPGAHFTSGALANLGAFVQGEVALGLTSTRDGDTFGTHSERYRGGLLYRLPVQRLEVDLHAGYSTHLFAVDPAGQAGGVRPNLPSVAFSGPRGGLAFRFKFSDKAAADLTGGFTSCTSLGELASARFFPDASAVGVDAALSFGWLLAPSLELRFTADYARYMVTVGERAAFPAENATDQYLGGNVGLSWVM